MIHIDRKIARIILKLSGRSYESEMIYDPSQKTLFLMKDHRDVLDSRLISIDPGEVSRSINRLIDNGFLEKRQGVWGGVFFGITPRLRHRFAFWADAFTKKFWGGFVTGVVTAVTANLLTGYVQSALSAAIQWLQHLR